MELSLYCAVIELLQHAAFQLMRQLSEGFPHTRLTLPEVLFHNAPPTQAILPPLGPEAMPSRDLPLLQSWRVSVAATTVSSGVKLSERSRMREPC